MALGASAGALHLLGCSRSPTEAANGNPTGACSRIPEETAGPYPGDASNGPNVLNLTGVVRSDIRSGFAALNGTADGVPLAIVLTIVSATTQNYLRGVQQADAGGTVTFASIFPACYTGRWPHIHFEVCLVAAASVSNKVAPSQLALPKATCALVYATAGYEASIVSLSQASLASDMVFSDGSALELATMTGSVSGGLIAALTVVV